MADHVSYPNFLRCHGQRLDKNSVDGQKIVASSSQDDIAENSTLELFAKRMLKTIIYTAGPARITSSVASDKYFTKFS